MPEEHRPFRLAIKLMLANVGRGSAGRQLHTRLESQLAQGFPLRIHPPPDAGPFAQNILAIAESNSIGQVHLGALQEKIYRVEQGIVVLVELVVRAGNEVVEVPVGKTADTLGIENRGRALLKTGMLGTERFRLDKERQRLQKVEHVEEFLLAALVTFDRPRMDSHLIEGMLAQVAPRNAMDHMGTACAIQLPKTERIELVIPHQGHGTPRIAHRAHQVDRLAHLRPTVDIVAEEDNGTGATRVTEGTGRFHVAQFRKQSPEFRAMPVNIANEVDGGIHDLKI